MNRSKLSSLTLAFHLEGVKLVATVVFVVLTFFFPTSASAKENFSLANDVEYTISESEITRVKMNFTLTNQTSDVFAKSHTLMLGFKDLSNISASDPLGPIRFSMKEKNEGYEITLRFNQKVVGINKSLPFTVAFDTKNIAKKLGGVWRINIPGLTNVNVFTSFNVHVTVPTSFGIPTYIKPNIVSLKDVEKGTSYTLSFTKKDLQESGISIGYGEAQLYAFTLLYHLKNPNLFPVTSHIALPPDTNYQTVEITSISQSPKNVIQDADGNWVAQYSLSSGEKKDITVIGTAKVFLSSKEETLKDEDFKKYLKDDTYWEVSNQEIKKIAQELKTPRQIYEYAVKTLQYDFARVTERKERLGALKALKNPKSAVCLEFTDMFITLARASGIPARAVDGYAVSENSRVRPTTNINDILHSWPEYYDRNKKRWIMVDPTWGKTTGGVDYFEVFDTDHFAFVIKGMESDYPIPAGGYKTNKSSKDITIDFIQEIAPPKSSFEFNFSFPKELSSLVPTSGKISIKNTGTTALKIPEFTFTAQNGFIRQSNQTNTIPPHGYVEKNITFYPSFSLTKRKDIITIVAADKKITQEINLNPYKIPKEVLLVGGVISGVFSIIIFIIAKRTRGLSIFRRK